MHIFCRADAPGDPKAIMAVPPGAMENGEEDGENGEPAGEMNLAIRETVLWHGAARCLQHN